MLSELDPRALPQFKIFLESLDIALGESQYIVFEGRRSVQTQEAYFAQGRKPLEEVNSLRRKAGLYLLRTDKDNYKITWTLGSKHINGLAMDVLPTDGGGSPTWDVAHFNKFFLEIWMCGKNAKLECGADWPSPETDWPHYEFKEGV